MTNKLYEEIDKLLAENAKLTADNMVLELALEKLAIRLTDYNWGRISTLVEEAKAEARNAITGLPPGRKTMLTLNPRQEHSTTPQAGDYICDHADQHPVCDVCEWADQHPHNKAPYHQCGINQHCAAGFTVRCVLWKAGGHAPPTLASTGL